MYDRTGPPKVSVRRRVSPTFHRHDLRTQVALRVKRYQRLGVLVGYTISTRKAHSLDSDSQSGVHRGAGARTECLQELHQGKCCLLAKSSEI